MQIRCPHCRFENAVFTDATVTVGKEPHEYNDIYIEDVEASVICSECGMSVDEDDIREGIHREVRAAQEE